MTTANRLLEEAHAEETTEAKRHSHLTKDDTIVAVKQVTFRYPQYEENERQEPTLNEVNLHVKQGEFVALLGHNGSGKSTLARLLNAQMLPQEGEITILGMDTRVEEKVWAIRSHCGMVFQNPDNQIVASVVEEDVAFGPENLGIPLPALRERVDAALAATGMTPYKRREPYKLSGGQKQRVAIAGVLAMLPECIILDEPTAMLDPVGRREIMDTIHTLNHDRNMTIILITHNMEEAVEADRIVVLSEGKIALEGTPREVFSDVETMRRLELDVPQVTEVGYRLRQAGFPVPADCLRMEELVEAIVALKGKKANAVGASSTESCAAGFSSAGKEETR